MTLVLSADGAEVTNGVELTGAPAVELRGDEIAFTNESAGRIRSTSAAAPAILITGALNEIVNLAGGVISGYQSTNLAISGSAFADEVENAGLIYGRVELGDGNDGFTALTGSVQDLVDLGAGDDVYEHESTSNLGRVEGGLGTDMLVLAMNGSVLNGTNATGFEILEVESAPGLVWNVTNFSGYKSVLLSPGAYYTFIASLNPDVAVEIEDGGFAVGPGSSFASILGGEGSETVEVNSGTVVGDVSLDAGNDVFWFSHWAAHTGFPSVGGTVDGGLGSDTLILAVEGGFTVDLARVTGFEILNGGTWTGLTSDVRVVNASGFTEIMADNGGKLVIGQSNLSAANLVPFGPTTVVLEATTTLGSIGPGAAYLAGPAPAANAGQSTDITNSGSILGNVILWTGNDRFDGRLGTVGGTVNGYVGNDTLLGSALGDRLYGGDGDDLLEGNAGADFLYGQAGADVLRGGADADLLDGGTGIDRMEGGTGDDIYMVDDFSDMVVELAGEGTDEVRTSTHFYLTWTPNVENLTSVAADGVILTGNDLDNVIRGASGNDWIDGAGGADTMIGGTGNDVYAVDSASDTVVEAAGAGYDEVRTSLASYTLGSAVESVRGDESKQVLTGNALDNSLFSYGGGDTLIGLGGDDLYVTEAGDIVIEQADGGRDAIVTSILVYTLPDNVEDLRANTDSPGYTFTGNALDNAINGYAGNDVLDGGAGADAMNGFVGNDIYYVDNVGDTIVDIVGTDEIRTTLATYSIAALSFIENLTGIAGTSQFLTGNEFANVITGAAAGDRLDGGDGNDTLVGNGGADTLNGGAGDDLLQGGADGDSLSGGGGDDRLDGGAGGDLMAGGGGNDLYIVDDAADSIVEAGNDGTDEIRTALAVYSMGAIANVENLTGTSNAGQTLTGGAGSQIVTGGAGDDVLDGGAGTDILRGGLGNDSYVLNAPGDTIVEAAGEGDDDIRTSASSFSLAGYANVEGLTGTSAAGQSLSGGDLADRITGASGDDILFGGFGDDVLIGNAGSDTLIGFGGSDVMRGGAGNDIYVIDAGDTVVELVGDGIDEVRTIGGIFVLATGLENLRAMNDEGHDFRGNDVANVIVGGDGNDIVRAQDGGGDLLFGKAGVDSFYMGGAFDNGDFIDGGDNRDSLILQGDYSAGLTLSWNITGGTSIANIESISLLSGSVTSFGDLSGRAYSYDLTMIDANLAAGALLKVNGVNLGAGENFTFDGAAEKDGIFQLFAGFGVDDLTGGQQGDSFIFAQDGRFGAGDSVDGQGGYDILYLRGDYAIDFNAEGFAGSLKNVESIALLTSANNEFAGGGDGDFDYELTWNDSMLAAGATLTVNGSRLQSFETFVFHGGSETDGSLRLFGGAGADTLETGGGNDQLHGGGGADALAGGAGADLFRYSLTSDSTLAAHDTIAGFEHGVDKIDLNRVDARAGTVDANEAFAFIGANAFSAAGPDGPGELRAYNVSGDLWRVEGDVNGDGTADLVIDVHVLAGEPLTVADFIL